MFHTHDILNKINAVNKIRQNPKFDIKSSIEALGNLKNYFVRIRCDENFESFFTEVRKIATELGIEEAFPRSEIPRIRRKKRHFDYEGADEPITSTELSFKVDFFFKILDPAIVSIDKRFQLLQQHTDVLRRCV